MPSSLDQLVKNLRKMNIATDFPEVYSYLLENNKDDIVTNNDDDSNLNNSLY